MKWYLESFQQGKRIVLILFYFYYYYFFCKERDLSLTIKMVSVLSKENTVKLLLRVSFLVIYSRNLLPTQKKLPTFIQSGHGQFIVDFPVGWFWCISPL